MNLRYIIKYINYYGIDTSLTPRIVENFVNQGEINDKGSNESGLPKGIPVIYRAGDQPNNALSLNILQPGEVATTGGTSGVIYAVTYQLKSKEMSRINSFVHVNYTDEKPTVGKLLCITWWNLSLGTPWCNGSRSFIS